MHGVMCGADAGRFNTAESVSSQRFSNSLLNTSFTKNEAKYRHLLVITEIWFQVPGATAEKM